MANLLFREKFQFPVRRGYACIGLHNPNSKKNVGLILRTSACFNAALVAITGARYGGSRTDAMKSVRHLPLIHAEDLRSLVPHNCVPVAVELVPQAKSILEYRHPQRAFYIFGPEDGSLGEETLSWCQDIVYVPTRFPLNLAACVNVVLYDRMMKMSRPLDKKTRKGAKEWKRN